jgi:DNA modification methylase
MMDEGTGVQLLQGDCRARLGELEAESVHLILTSPPYHGLRDYGTGEWEGGDEGCDHKAPPTGGPNPERYTDGGGEMFRSANDKHYRDLCGKCGARRTDQQIGLEDSAEAHIAVLVDVFREARRVLRPDGCLIVNYGDAYAQNGGSKATEAELQQDAERVVRKGYQTEAFAGYKGWQRASGSATKALPAKNLLMLPSRLAIALQADGWILRSMMPWLKRSAMPESATDRPSTAVEYVFIFSKSQRYFWDADAVRRGHTASSLERYRHGFNREKVSGTGLVRADDYSEVTGNPNGRNLRNSDFYFDSLDLSIEATRSELAHLLHLREKGGLLLDQEGEPLALDVNPQALADAHFASFPEKLVAPLIQAGTSEWGCCSVCGAPWTRQVEKGEFIRTGGSQNTRKTEDGFDKGANMSDSGLTPGFHRTHTTGWQPSCDCVAGIVPCVVLDPFAGSGTTSLVASKLGRRSIAIELSQPYTEIFNRRNSQKSLLL